MSAKDTLCQMLKTLGFEATVTEQNYEDMLLLDIQTDEPKYNSPSAPLKSTPPKVLVVLYLLVFV
jgi:hypothetical protein